MGCYAKYVLPRIIDLAMRNKEAAGLRAAWIPRAYGDVLEVGIGSGLNLPFYSSKVRRVYGADPSAELQAMALRRAKELPLPVDFFLKSAEDPLPFDVASIDTVVVTWTLCSIPKPSKALEQVRRLLRPNGRLIFIEHGLAPEARIAAWQDRLNPIWKCIGGGCHLNRKIDDLISRAGFRITELKSDYLPGPRPMTYTYQGIAEPSTFSEAKPS
jgi:SAM-dependent methyltransferase